MSVFPWEYDESSLWRIGPMTNWACAFDESGLWGIALYPICLPELRQKKWAKLWIGILGNNTKVEHTFRPKVECTFRPKDDCTFCPKVKPLRMCSALLTLCWNVHSTLFQNVYFDKINPIFFLLLRLHIFTPPPLYSPGSLLPRLFTPPARYSPSWV